MRKQFILDPLRTAKPNPVREYEKGFEECKRRVIEILKRDWVGADMSINSCDQYYIDKVKDL